MTAAEGREIVTAALEQGPGPKRSAGLLSRCPRILPRRRLRISVCELFRNLHGNENFARVKMPRAGDLIRLAGTRWNRRQSGGNTVFTVWSVPDSRRSITTDRTGNRGEGRDSIGNKVVAPAFCTRGNLRRHNATQI